MLDILHTPILKFGVSLLINIPCTVLYCTVLNYVGYIQQFLYWGVSLLINILCTVLYCTVLYCTVLNYVGYIQQFLYWGVSLLINIHCTVLYCTVLYCTVQVVLIRWIELGWRLSITALST